MATVLENLRGHLARNPLREWRDKNSVSQGEVAALLGVSISTLQRWESGIGTINASHLPRLVVITGNDAFADEFNAWFTQLQAMR
jgi:DNA-binding transcriptional regulator YiaG